MYLLNSVPVNPIFLTFKCGFVWRPVFATIFVYIKVIDSVLKTVDNRGTFIRFMTQNEPSW